MDINALLSPSADAASSAKAPGSEREVPLSNPSSPASSPRKSRAPPARPLGSKRTTSGLSNEVRRSPDISPSHISGHYAAAYADAPHQQRHHLQSQGHHHVAAATSGFRPLPPTSTPSTQPQPDPSHVQAHQGHSSVSSSQYQPQQQHGDSQRRPSVPQRGISHPRLESLSDLARLPMSPGSARSPSIADPLNSPSLSNASANGPPPTIRSISAQSLADLTMAEAPSSTPPPRAFTSTSLPAAELQTVTDLLAHLTDNSYDYNSHVALIDLLHKGFSNEPNPRNYHMLSELRQAREAMDTRFAVGEDTWVAWLADEVSIADTSEERIAVTELFQRAVQDEPASIKLWMAFVDWIDANYAACNNLETSVRSVWTERDIEICQELFTRQMLLDILGQAVPATQWRIDESHLIWNRYIEEVQKDLPSSPSDPEADRLRDLFVNRLQTPHLAWDETMQLFWPFVSKSYGQNWESVMDQAKQAAEPGKRQTALREEHELKLQQALTSGDKNAAFLEFEDYLRWERKYSGRGSYGPELCCALYERALLSFPTYTEWWLDYVDFVIEGNPSTSVLPLIERSTKHTPWSGDLWAKRILRSDIERRPHSEIESTKHRATNSSLVDVGGMDELVKVLGEWCSFLRRYAFRAGASEDDLDTAEVGIFSALEDVKQIGQKLYGEEFKGDPLYRLEQIQIKFLSEARRFSEARDIYRKLVPLQKDKYEFWWRYYNWELWLWGYERITEKHRVETTENGPHLATAVGELAISQKGLDLPEKVLDMYLYHFTQHESSEKLQGARISARAFAKQIALRRAREAEEVATTAADAQQQAISEAIAIETASLSNASDNKRKRDDDTTVNGDSYKKSRVEGPLPEGVGEASASTSAQVKRDRENSTVTIKNLPADATEMTVKKFFQGCGGVISVELSVDASNDSATATVEFETPEDASFAQSRDGRELDGRQLQLQSGSQSTLWVTNYPDVYDEAAIRQLFGSYGEIVSVRFPSLKFNSRRRFCYVQFLTASIAKAAESAMDGKMLDGKHKLRATISAPGAKQSRSGPQSEKRELFVKNIERDSTEAEIKDFFEQYGKVERMTLLRKVNGVLMGNGFIVFVTPEDASAALAANNKPFKDRILHVDLSTPKGGVAPVDKARKTDIIVKHHEHTPDPQENDGRSRRTSDVSMASSTTQQQQQQQQQLEAKKTANERKVALLHLPDTVNDARIQATMEQYGRVKKIQLRRQDEAAIVEFEDLKVAFKVRSGVDVDVSALGKDVRTADVTEVFNKAKARHTTTNNAGTSGLMKPPAMSRPGLGGGNRRGGLGFKRGGGVAAPSTSTSRQEGAGNGPAKSNADFRNLFVKPKDE
ncbi:hypothetical protein K431DRAFT_107536 [Polychaeton citri CBS 116435]|uniref:RRM domain-containing protein n=1 Tax=Polychaeton citri CBS 116435 TaxID=1314669 RepID=A0A9P4UMJ4_9PEZI|nr:hypothetical protein K431DRAFT_107536 [Polychaeton citri CBS 116435]